MKPENLMLLGGILLTTAGAAMLSVPAGLITAGGLAIFITLACAWIGRH